MKGSRVTVITRTRDRLHFVRRAIQSLRAQTFDDWEHVIVVDGADVKPVERIIGELRHAARIVHLATRQGMEAASNAALAVAKGRSIIFLDDDDTWVPTCLERLVAARDASGGRVRAALCHSAEVREHGVSLDTLAREVWNGSLSAVALDALAVRNLFTNNAFLVDRAVVTSLGGFDAQLPVYGDWDFNLRFFSQYDAVVVPEALANYHRRVGSTGEAANSFAQDLGVAGRGRARLLQQWLAGIDGRNPYIGQLIALGPRLEAQAAVDARIDKLFNALHRLRRAGPLAALERVLGR